MVGGGAIKLFKSKMNTKKGTGRSTHLRMIVGLEVRMAVVLNYNVRLTKMYQKRPVSNTGLTFYL
jgi:hypothetical protein